MPTVGRIANGAIIEKEIEFALNKLNMVRLALRNADFTTAKRIASAINDYIGAPIAEPLDPSTVQISLPQKSTGNVVALLTEIEQLQVDPDIAAKVIIDERSGIIVLGPRRAGVDGCGRPGQPHGHNLRKLHRRSKPSRRPSPPRTDRGDAALARRRHRGRLKGLALVREGVSLQQSWSMASMRWASAHAISIRHPASVHQGRPAPSKPTSKVM